jgi:hypothetical protein
VRAIGAALRARGGRITQQLELVRRKHKNSAPRPVLLRPALPQRRALQVSPCQPELDWPGIHELALLSVL